MAGRLAEDLDAHDVEVAPAMRARALADKAALAATFGFEANIDEAEQALTIAREIGDPALLVRALTARGAVSAWAWTVEAAGPYLAEAIGIARAIGDRWRLVQILGWRVVGAWMTGDPIAARAVADEGLAVCEAIGAKGMSRPCRWLLGWAQIWAGDLAGAAELFREVVAEAEAAHDAIWRFTSVSGEAFALVYQGAPTRPGSRWTPLWRAGQSSAGGSRAAAICMGRPFWQPWAWGMLQLRQRPGIRARRRGGGWEAITTLQRAEIRAG